MGIYYVQLDGGIMEEVDITLIQLTTGCVYLDVLILYIYHLPPDDLLSEFDSRSPFFLRLFR